MVKVQLASVQFHRYPKQLLNSFLPSITTYAFSCAVALSASVTFFALQQHGIEINWSGNSLPFEGLDAAGPRLRTLVDGEHFGPGIGEF